MKKIYNYTDSYQRAMGAVVPERTETYTPISHAIFLQTLRDKLRDSGYEIIGRRIYSNENGEKIVGFFDVRRPFTTIEQVEDQQSELLMSIGFRNSYDKSMKIGLAAGASVVVCGNGVIMGSMLTFVRKHNGSADTLLQEKITEVVAGLDESFGKIKIEIDLMKDFTLTKKQKAEILGRMYFDEELLTPTQMSVVKYELNKSEHFTGNTLWDLYNNVTEALKSTPPIHHIENHVKVHSFLAKIAGITDAVVIEETPQVEATQSTEALITMVQAVHPEMDSTPVPEMNELRAERGEAMADVVEELRRTPEIHEIMPEGPVADEEETEEEIEERLEERDREEMRDHDIRSNGIHDDESIQQI